MQKTNNPTPPLADVFVANLRQFIHASGKTQKAIAEQSGVSENAITKLLRGTTQVKFETVDRLAAVLEIDRIEFYRVETKAK